MKLRNVLLWLAAPVMAAVSAIVLTCSLLLLAPLSNRSTTDERGTP